MFVTTGLLAETLGVYNSEAKRNIYKNNPTNKVVGGRGLAVDAIKPWKPGVSMNKIRLQTGFNQEKRRI